MAEDFNLVSDSMLDAQGANLTMKKKSLAKLTELKESRDLCDIWRVRNLESRQITFTYGNFLQVLFNKDLITFSFQLRFKN